MDVGQPPLSPPCEPQERPSRPRERLEALLTGRLCDRNEKENEILHLARENPEAFAADIIRKQPNEYGSGPKEDRRSPLNYFMARRSTVSIEAFEAVYAAFPAAIHSIDSFGDTVLSELLSRADSSDAWFELLKAVINKSNKELAVSRDYDTPIVKAIEKACSEEVVQYMIDHYPGDPFREHAPYQRTLLSAVVRQHRHYSFGFLKYIFEQNPEAVRVQETDKCESPLLLAACENGCEEAVIRLLLRAYPEGAFVLARYAALPLQGLFGSPDDTYYNSRKLLRNKSSIAMVALATPDAIFSQTYDKNSSPSTFSPFTSIVTKKFLDRYYEKGSAWRAEQEGSEYAVFWSFLFLLISIYRYGDETNVTEAWSPPQYPAHMAASCPCPSGFLVLMAKSSPDHLLRGDDEGRSVLALALESGHNVGVRHYDEEGSIRQLVQVDIRMLGLQDPTTQLYPFMTAACNEEKIVKMDIMDCYFCRSSYGEKLKEEIRAKAPLKCLNTIYFLLRADPSKAQLGRKSVNRASRKRPRKGDGPDL